MTAKIKQTKLCVFSIAFKKYIIQDNSKVFL